MIDQAKFDAFMAAVRGIPNHHVTKAMSCLTPGIDWSKSPKHQMAEAYASDAHIFGRGVTNIKLEALTAMAKARVAGDPYWYRAEP